MECSLAACSVGSLLAQPPGPGGSGSERSSTQAGPQAHLAGGGCWV